MSQGCILAIDPPVNFLLMSLKELQYSIIVGYRLTVDFDKGRDIVQ